MESFFFVPGNRINNISQIQQLKVSHIIIDLEDAVKFSEREAIVEDLSVKPEYQDFYIRVPLYDLQETLEISIFNKLYHSGFRKFIFPKIGKASDIDEIVSQERYADLQIILLVETTRFFLEVKDVLIRYQHLFSGIGLGSHDFMSEVGGVHNLKNLEYARQQILYMARMVQIKAIDIASMELNDKITLEQEIVDGFYKGYDAKFFIHPWQVTLFNSLFLYSKADFEWAENVSNELAKVGSKGEFVPIVLDGQVIERPHLTKAQKILKYYESK